MVLLVRLLVEVLLAVVLLVGLLVVVLVVVVLVVVVLVWKTTMIRRPGSRVRLRRSDGRESTIWQAMNGCTSVFQERDVTLIVLFRF
jgi:hypothetical protein